MPNVLRNHLNSQGPDVEAQALKLLARCWNQLEGNDLNAMAGYKVLRAKNLKWNDPRLEFDIERHGGAALGSTRTEMQHWILDLVARTAECTTSGHRQLSPMRPPMSKDDMRRIAADLANKVATSANDPRLEWSADRKRVRVRALAVNPAGDLLANQTKASRSRRLKEAINPEFARLGWHPRTGGWYQP